MSDLVNLQPKHYLVLEEYLSNGMKKAEAYQTLYPNSSLVAASKSFARIMRHPDAKEYIKRRYKEILDEACITSDRVVLELGDIAFAEKGDADYPVNAKLKALSQISEMLGYNAPSKIEANIKEQIVFVDDIPDTDETETDTDK